MIVLPAIPAIVAALTPIVEAAVISAGIGAVVSGAICGVGDAISGYHDRGAFTREVAMGAAQETAQCAGEGALIGGAFGVGGAVIAPVVAPALQAVDDVARPIALKVADDAARPVLQAADDVVRPLVQAVDDAFTGFKNAAKSAVNGIHASVNRMRNGWNARNFRSMKDAPAGTRYVYVMEDSTNGLHKIGMTTKSPSKRLGKVASEAKSELDYTCIIQTDKNSKLEGKLHSLISKQSTTHPTPGYDRKEWFVLSAAQVAAACSH